MDALQNIISIALFVPFGILFLIFAIVFMRKGYKDGLWRSLISLGATVVSLILSMLLGKLVGKALAGVIYDALPNSLFEEAGMMEDLLGTLIQALIQAVMSIMFFGLFMLIFIIVMKAISKRVHWKKLDEATTNQSKGMRWAGLGIRALDAIVLTVLLLLPLYGTIATLVSPITSAVAIAADEDDEAVESLQAVSEHPVVKVYKKGPAAAVYRGVASFNMGSESFELMEITETMEGIIIRVQAIEAAAEDEDEDAYIEALSDLAVYTRESVIEEPWCYQMLQALREELENLDELEDLEDTDELVYQQIMDLLDMSEEDFQENGVALMEFIEFALDDDYMAFFESGDLEELDSDFYEELGDLINCSKQSIAMKKLIMTYAAASLLDAGWTEESYEEALEDAADFVDEYISDKATKSSLREQEAEALVLLIYAEDVYEAIDAFALHPAVGESGARELSNEIDFSLWE